MIDKELLQTLVCPQDRTPLKLADKSTLAKVNRAIAAGRVKNRAGHRLEESLQGALLRRDRTVLYPIVDDIPVLLVEEAILLEPIE